MINKRSNAVFACYFLLTALAGVFYIPNAPDFGKSVVALWGVAALVLDIVGIIVLWFNNRLATGLICMLIIVLQLPPVYCWGIFVTDQLAGVPGWLGLTFHLAMQVWGIVNIAVMLKRK